MTRAPDPVPPDVPAAFLPPPKRGRKHFTDETLFDPPPGGPPRELVLDELVAEQIAANPGVVTGVPWKATAKERARRRRERP